MFWDFLFTIYFYVCLIVGLVFFAGAMILCVFILVSCLREHHEKNEELETPDYDEDEVRMKGRP